MNKFLLILVLVVFCCGIQFIYDKIKHFIIGLIRGH